MLNAEDEMLMSYVNWNYSNEVLDVGLSATSTQVGNTILLTAKQWSNNELVDLNTSATFFINNQPFITSSGTLEYSPDVVGDINIYVEAEAKTRSDKKILTATPLPQPITINLRIESTEKNILDSSINIPYTCQVNNTNTFTGYKAICALETAQEQGLLTFKTSAFGESLFVNSINDIGGGENMFWALYKKNSPADVGATDLVLNAEDEMLMSYVNWNFGNEVLNVKLSTTSTQVGNAVLLTAQQWNGTEFVDFLNTSSTFFINDQPFITASGTLEYILEKEQENTVYMESENKTRSKKNTFTATPTSTPPVEPPQDNPSPPPPPPSGPTTQHYTLNINRAVQYLIDQQNPVDGSISIYNDWVAMAFSAYNKNDPASLKLKQYLLTDPTIEEGKNKVSSYTKRAMALMSLGVNPYDGVPNTNYIKKITDYYDGTEFYDNDPYNKGLYNDDIFALITLLCAGYTTDDPIITSTTQYILSKQNNGVWIGPDITAAAIQALSPVKNLPNVNDTLNKAKDYLHQKQQSDGGWKYMDAGLTNVPSTAWIMQAITTFGENPINWENNGKNPNDYLNSQQDNDGGIKPPPNSGSEKDTLDARILATAEAIPAGLNKSWSQILGSFNKPTPSPINPGPGPSYTTTTFPIATTTLEIATTTLAVATTTEPLVLGEKITQDETIISESTTPAPHIAKPITNNVTIQQFNNEPELAKEIKIEQTNEIINNLPLDTPTRKAAKKVAAVTGGSAVAVGLYLGFRLLKNVI